MHFFFTLILSNTQSNREYLGSSERESGQEKVSQKLKDVKVLAEEEFAKMTVEDWRKTCRYCIIHWINIPATVPQIKFNVNKCYYCICLFPRCPNKIKCWPDK